MSRTRVAAVVATIAVMLLSSCSADVMVRPTPSPEPSLPPASGDGVLRIGTLLPTAGESAAPSPTQVAAVELAVREINEAGGVLGAPVEVYHRDSGDASSPTAEASFADLSSRGVDVVIAAADPAMVERILPLALADGVAVIVASGTATQFSSIEGVGLPLHTVPEGRDVDEAFGARVRSMDPRVTDVRFAAEAYDAVILAALAAVSSGDDGGASLALAVVGVSGGGVGCASFGECLEVMKSRDDIDYDGISGPLDLDVDDEETPAS